MYSKKDLRYEFTLSNGAFDKNGNDKISIGNVKSSFRYGAYGNYGGIQAEIMIFGLSIDRLASLSGKGIGVYTPTKDISVNVYSGDNKIFSGGIYASYANMNAQPETALVMNTISGLNLKTASSSAFSQPGAVPVESMLSAICNIFGFSLNASRLNGRVAQNPHFSGSPMDQVRDICLAHGLWYRVFDNIITVWPAGSAVDDIVPLVSPDSGLIGYPVFTQSGITFQTQFSTYLAQGRVVELVTSLPNASGRYLLTVVEHFLNSWTEGGSWHTVCQGFKINQDEKK
ncbi:hypothetical protein BED35_06040 [Yersinia enterocolitica]|uniref:hypothetical protein n=1 Tax=Yersinia enterocolitica TaxID=630 RepID=UPI000327DFFE|nr:hypothetical protein [Yersinia enterocolitica]AOF18158.1 hypothetical protein BED34_05590 [Yersinia enterocolitica]AOF22690.1 hypothetical protein BED33_08250 [Yersinia enterocolitica]AOF26399.1 hypothetical protein BED32_05565 [Yersinia enterocolitica]AOF30512.1 hypothetical protein BED35_06040 [Yersinia enterocolitica]AOF34433.1 hypothetical protein BFS78_05105 [Yersinia enterocolitica]